MRSTRPLIRAGFLAGAVLASLLASIAPQAAAQAPDATLPASTDDRCSHFRFPADAERRLFARPVNATAAAGHRPGRGPVLALGRLYELSLKPFPRVGLAGRPFVDPGAGSYAGLARFTVPASGRYRVSADGAVWLDLVVNGISQPALAFSGSPGCFAPHKIVVFELEAGQDVVVQVTGSGRDTLRLALTAER
jgi:hypothetical protein